jgi:hypothetical protein
MSWRSTRELFSGYAHNYRKQLVYMSSAMDALEMGTKNGGSVNARIISGS